MTTLRSGLFSGAFIAAAATLAPAGEPQTSRLAPLYACAGLSTDAEKLACFDRETATLKAAEASGEMSVISPEQVREAETKAFGLSKSSAGELAASAGLARKPKEDESPDAIVLTVKAISTDPDGRLWFDMENGQVWRQTDSMVLPHLGKGPWTARIRKASFGSFFLNLDDRRAVRAKRIR